MSSNGRVEVKKGSSVILECKAVGNPLPRLTWSRKNNLLPGGDQTAITSVLSLDRVDRHHAGTYQCTASNGIGEDAFKQIVLHVLCKYSFRVESGKCCPLHHAFFLSESWRIKAQLFTAPCGDIHSTGALMN